MKETKDIQLIKKWGQLRHPDPRFTQTAINYYRSLPEDKRKQSLEEMTTYIQEVEKGYIIPSAPKLPIKVFRNI